MKKTYCLVLATLSLLVTEYLTLRVAKARPLDIRFMTFNLRNGQTNNGGNV